MNVHIDKKQKVVVLSFKDAIEAMDVVSALASQIAPMLRAIKSNRDARYLFSPLVLALRMSNDSKVTDFELQRMAQKILIQQVGIAGPDGRSSEK